MNANDSEPSFVSQLPQNQVGWQRILKGRSSHHWIQIQGRHVLDNPELSSEKTSGEGWLKQILHHLRWTDSAQASLACSEMTICANATKIKRTQATQRATTTSPSSACSAGLVACMLQQTRHLVVDWQETAAIKL
jgi:hypothetical protein